MIKRKLFNETGPNGTFDGVVNILIDAEHKLITTHNHSTHDETTTNVAHHKISVSVNGTTWMESPLFKDKEVMFKEISNFENELKSHLKYLANHKPVKTLEDKLTARGYK